MDGDVDDEIEELGGLLREYRRAAGLTQAALAEAAGLSERGIQNIERGVRRPYRRTVAALVAALGLGPMQGARLTSLAARESAPSATPAGRPVPPAAVGERKPATVLCARIANLPLLQARLGAMVLRSVAGECLAAMQQEVERHGGAIERVDESGLIAVFGVPVARQDHAAAALRAALAIRDALTANRARVAHGWGVPLTVRIGLDSGAVELYHQGRDWRIVSEGTGSPLDRSAGLERNARPDAIWVGAAARQAAGDGFVWQEISAGRSGDGRASELLAAKDGRAVPTGGRTPIVGRLAELAQLWGAWEEVQVGRGRVVSITGEAGIGKSRLVAELARRLDEQKSRWLAASCFAHADATTYQPFRELLRACLELQPGTPAPTHVQIAEPLSALGLDPTAATYLGLLLGATVDDPLVRRLPPALLRTRTIEAVVRVLLATADRRPLVIVLEDVHWIDDGSEAILAALVEGLRARPLLLVLTARSEGLHPWAGGAVPGHPTSPMPSASMAATLRAILRRPQATHLSLGRLSPTESQRLVEQVADQELPPELVRLAAERAAGVPLFAVALSRALMDDASTHQHHDPTNGSASTRPSAIDALPATIRDVLLARVDHLPPSLKRVLQTAAVIGPEQAYPILAEVMEQSPELESALVRLEDLGFLHLARLAPERCYTFDHVLMQVAVYETLLPEAARRQHERVGRAIEAVYADRLEEQYELLAHHYARGADDEKAVEYLVLASRKAVAASAMAAAHDYFEAARARLDRLPDTEVNRARRADVVLEQFPVMLLLGRLPAYHALLRECEPLVTGLGNRARLAAYYTLVGACEWASGEVARARATLLRATTLAADADDEVRAMADVTLQRCELDLGHYPAALLAYERVRPVVDRLLNLHWYLWTLTGAMWAHAYQGRWAEARAVGSQAVHMGEDLDDPGMQSHVLLNLAIISLDQGDPDRAAGEVGRALELATSPADRLMAEATAGWVTCRQWRRRGEAAAHAQAIVAQEQAAAALEAVGPMAAAINIGIGLGESLLVIRQTERARATLVEYGRRAERAGMRFQHARAERLLGGLALATDDEAAERHLVRSVEILTELGAENELALARATYGHLLARRGQHDAAREQTDWAVATLSRLGTRDGLERIRMDLEACMPDAVDVRGRGALPPDRER